MVDCRATDRRSWLLTVIAPIQMERGRSRPSGTGCSILINRGLGFSADRGFADVLLDQSMLTGESIPIDVGAGTQTYAGALVRRGEATSCADASARADIILTLVVLWTRETTLRRGAK